MQVVKNETINKEYEIYKKSWAMIKEFYYIQNVDDEEEQKKVWEEINKRAREIFYIQGDDAVCRFAKNISLSVLDYLADKCKLKRRW